MNTFWGHSLVPKPYYDVYKSQCALVTTDDGYDDNVPGLCSTFIDNLLDFSGDFNPYAVDYDNCLLHPSSTKLQRFQLLRHLNPNSRLVKERVEQRSKKLLASTDVRDPCEDSYVSQYLNSAEVKSALHVEIDNRWAECSDSIDYAFNGNSTAPLYTSLLATLPDIHILVYSGNDDAVCATIGTQHWLFSLGIDYKPTQYWRPYVMSGQIGGYLTQFSDDSLKFLVISGAGHEVPFYKPIVALDMFRRFLSWEWDI
jgi:carboxypeptidase C (cathepsin A)